VLNENRATLSRYRVEQARKCREAALVLVEADAYNDAANRSYYCIFHAMRAVLAIDGFDSKKHTGIISAFRQNYIKTSIFPPEFSDIIRDAFNIRGGSDYEDFFIVSKDEVLQQIENAKIFLEALEDYLNTIFKK